MILGDETERMAGRIEKDPPLFIRLNLCLAGSERQHLTLSLIEILDGEVEVRLLGMIGTRPHRGPMIGSQLKCQGWPGLIS